MDRTSLTQWTSSATRTCGRGLLTSVVLLITASLASAQLLPTQAPPTQLRPAQQRPVHRLLDSNSYPGTIVSPQKRAQPDVAGYLQPVRILVPEDAAVSIATDGNISRPDSRSILVGVLVGPAYRLCVNFIDREQSVELFPTLELLDRLHPPAGEATRFPIQIQLTEDDLRQANEGHLVTKVIYLENPHDAIAKQDDLEDQRWFETLPYEDPLKVADDRGKPIAIVRIGSRTVGPAGPDSQFLFGCPHVEMLAAAELASHSTDRAFARLSDRPNAAGVTGAHYVPSAEAPCATGMPCEPGAPCGPGTTGGGCAAHDQAHPFEYLCDGGDGLYATGISLRALEPEDTVARYAGRDGQKRLTASNQVCVYAPRFAAVRRVTRVHVGDEYLAVEAAALPTLLELAERRTPPIGVDQPLPVEGRTHTDLATPFVDNDVLDELALRHPIEELIFDYQPHEDFQIVRIGVYEKNEQWAMLEFLDAVTTWTVNEAAQIVVEDASAYEMIRDQEAGTVYSFRDPEGPKLRLIKLASTKAAQPGDTVDFTLRFDNVGHSEAKEIVIVDNLTTRLEYVAGSAQCSHQAEFSTRTNDGQSLELTWKLLQPVPAGKGGVIRFRCQVR